MNEAIYTHSLISDLSNAHLAKFEELVLKEVKSSVTEEEIAILKSSLDLWLYTLSSIRRNVEYSLSSRNSNRKSTISDMISKGVSDAELSSYKKSESEWRVNAIKFLSTIEKKTLYVKLLMKEERKFSQINY
jgi:hypothetical protein